MQVKGTTMSKEKVVKKINVRQIAQRRALLTKKPYKSTTDKGIGRLFHSESVVAFLKSLLPDGYVLTVAENTTGKGETLKVTAPDGSEVERLFFASEKMKAFSGMWGFGKPQLKRMLSILAVGEDTLCVARQGTKDYWFNDDYDLLGQYISEKYNKDTK
jgi:hypothetical protein